MAKSSADKELDAMRTIIGALQGLDSESIERVITYVLGRLSVSSNRNYATATMQVTQPVYVPPDTGQPARRPSIRDLKDEKQPQSLNQMTALVAYYLSEIAPQDERQSTIGVEELTKYLKQAGFRLPKQMRSALPNATAAGYFDSAGSGRFRLNPVGYNLVVHGLPPAQEREKRARTARKSGR